MRNESFTSPRELKLMNLAIKKADFQAEHVHCSTLANDRILDERWQLTGSPFTRLG